MTDQINNQGAGNPVTFQPGAQAQPGEIDTRAAAQAMALYGLDPTGDDALEFARAYSEDTNRNDPHNRDRYSRAAQAAATAKRQAEAMQRLGSLSDPRLAQDRDALWKIANYKAAPIAQETKRVVSVLDTTNDRELFRMAAGKGDAVPDTLNDSVTSEAWRRMADAGVVIDSDDPESKMIDTSSPERFLASIDKAIEAKQSKSVLDITDPGELFRLAKKQGLI